MSPVRPDRFVLSVIFTLSLTGMIAGPAAAGSHCATPDEVKAAQLRQLHDELQVAALNCRGDDPKMHDKWGAYVNRFGDTLAGNARLLRGYFSRAYGGDGIRQFDRYNTSVTNHESVRVHAVEGYCEMHSAMIDTVLELRPEKLADFAAQKVGTPADITACPPGKSKK